jgi:hypothetical protein
MLDIKFYPPIDNIDNSVEIIEIPDSLYEYLIKSGFAKIGKSKKLIVLEEGEKIKTSAVTLNNSTRNKFKDLFQKLVLEECDGMCSKLNNLSSAKEDLEAFNKLKALNSLYKLTKNKEYYYLDRGDVLEKKQKIQITSK